MNLNFAAVLLALPGGAEAIVRIMNAARPSNDYLFQTLLPEMPRWTYTVDSGTLTVRAVMAGLSGMDSPYRPGGVIEASTFLEQAAKITNVVTLPEQALRQIQSAVQSLVGNATATNEFIQNEALNFLEKLIVQPHLDTMEWLRAQALVYGQIDWKYGDVELVVDYGIPTSHKLATAAGTDAYGGSTSIFWDNVRTAKRLLRYNVRTIIAHPDTIDEIVFNDVNSLEVTAQDGMSMTVRRVVGDNDRPSGDTRDQLTLLGYSHEADAIDPANPGQVIHRPFMPKGKLLFVGNNTRTGYRVGEGSTDDPVADAALGYTHLAPTVEGGGQPGRWARLYTPEGRAYQLVGEGVTNGLPVIENPEKLVIATTEMS